MDIERLRTKEKLPQPHLEVRQEKSLEFMTQSIQNYESVGDEEAMFMLALSLDHPEWKEVIMGQIEKHKPHVQNPEELLERLNDRYLTSEWQSHIEPNAADTRWWLAHLPEAEARTADLIVYFRPAPSEVAKKIVIVPSDTLLASKETGRSFHVGDTAIIMSHTENLDNFEHEFLHGIINPITEELEGEIPEEKVVALASNKLREEEMYGNHAISLLNEELIRTYTHVIKLKKPLRTIADIETAVGSLDEDSFAETVSREPRLKERLSAMGISSLVEFKGRTHEYWKRYEQNELQRIVYGLYERFNVEKAIHPKISFKKFLTSEIKTLFD